MRDKFLTFDIETIPDIENAKKIYEIEHLNDEDAWKAIQVKRLEKSGTDFLPHYLQKIIAISVVFQDHQSIKVWSIGNDGETEAEIISRFFSGLEKHQPTLISWNGQGFDLPVLHYRSLLHHIQAPIYWESGENLQEFKWNNYFNRYHYRHIDLMDVLSGFQNRAFAPLDELAQMMGLPGKIGLHGSEVYGAYLNGEIDKICNYCESDVLNTYLLFLRFNWTRGLLSLQQYLNLLEQLQTMMDNQQDQQHWRAFLPYIEQLAINLRQ